MTLRAWWTPWFRKSWVNRLKKSFTIAISGKGGVGKTNLAALMVRHLSTVGSVLAIDADPDSNLPQALGCPAPHSVGEIREDILNAPARSPLAAEKPEALRRAMAEVMVETDRFDLVVMGRSEGEGCYCAVNHILRQIIDGWASSYDFTIIDCEAGLEHLSRRTTRDVDLLLAVTDATKNGILTARRVQELCRELHVEFGRVLVVANRITPQTMPVVKRLAEENGLNIVGFVPYDPLIAELDLQGRPVMDLPADSPACQAVADICNAILVPASP